MYQYIVLYKAAYTNSALQPTLREPSLAQQCIRPVDIRLMIMIPNPIPPRLHLLAHLPIISPQV